MAKKIVPGTKAEPSAPAAALAKPEIKKIQGLLKSKTAEGVTLGLSLLESLGATTSDFEAVFTEQVIKAVLDGWLAESWSAVAQALVLHGKVSDLFQRLAQERFQYRPPRKHSTFEGLLLSQLPAARISFLKVWSDKSRETQTFLDLVEIPAGSFIMGSPGNESKRDEHEQQTCVTIAKPFQIARTVTTQGQWMAVMGSQPWMWARGRWSTRFKSIGGWKRLDDAQCGTDFPAVDVSWDDAELFCKTLTELERMLGRLTASQEYCLPTEAEWEFACRAGTATTYSFGDDPNEIGKYGWYFRNSNGRLHEVAQKLPNPWGLFDMHGNVEEWCADWYQKSLLGGVDPGGPPSGACRVCRGGMWGDNSSKCRSAFRNYSGKWSNFAGRFGFRVVLRG